jgi:molybdopterin/thiamine biosynthesis adenylyltransferase
MEIWFLDDPARLHREREAIRELESRATWLAGTSWLLERALALDAIIVVGAREYPVRVTYPEFFPIVPPIVRPQEPDARWSSHQYGSGTLCLEWGPDNWHPDVTGSQMLESTHRLLSLEAHSESTGHDVVPSRHSLTVGQALRGSISRFYFGTAFRDYLGSIPSGSRGTFEFSSHWQGGEGLYLVQKIEMEGREAWEDGTIPEGMRAATVDGYLRTGAIFVADDTHDPITASCSTADLEGNLGMAGFQDVSLHDGFASVLVAVGLGTPRFYLSTTATPGSLILIPSVTSASDADQRNPAELRALEHKSIGIVGLGSAGSKVALSLARMGVSHFYLVDEDVLLPENICRHALDWRYIGYHKVDALRDSLLRIRAGIKVEVSPLNLTGQESNAATSGVLRRLGQCDLIIDATADSGVFNLLASVSTMRSRPLVWLEVYAGGIGGIIARSRPGKDPRAHRVRDAYHGYTSENPAPELVKDGPYGARSPSGVTMVASDGDVGVIAANAARLAVDTVLGTDPSDFPHSVYLIGLRRAWVFAEPFHTIPIDCGPCEEPEAPMALDGDQAEEQLSFLGELIGKLHDANPPT